MSRTAELLSHSRVGLNSWVAGGHLAGCCCSTMPSGSQHRAQDHFRWRVCVALRLAENCQVSDAKLLMGTSVPRRFAR